VTEFRRFFNRFFATPGVRPSTQVIVICTCRLFFPSSRNEAGSESLAEMKASIRPRSGSAKPVAYLVDLRSAFRIRYPCTAIPHLIELQRVAHQCRLSCARKMKGYQNGYPRKRKQACGARAMSPPRKSPRPGHRGKERERKKEKFEFDRRAKGKKRARNTAIKGAP